MPKKKSWYLAEPKKSKPKVPDAVKKALLEKAELLIESKFKPEHLKPPPDNDSNYISDIYPKWHHHYFYFCTTILCEVKMLLDLPLKINLPEWNI